MDSLLLFLSLQVTIVILKLVFRSEICHFFPPFFLRMDSFHSASVAISVLALFVSFLAWVAPNAAERGAKERHRHAVKKEEQDWLLKGLDALHRGQNLNFSPWEPFFVAVKKNEAAARARGWLLSQFSTSIRRPPRCGALGPRLGRNRESGSPKLNAAAFDKPRHLTADPPAAGGHWDATTSLGTTALLLV